MAADTQENLVSVLISVHNGLRHLPQAVNSILSQSYTSFELIVIDDGSDDGSGEWLEKRSVGEPRMVVVRQANMGLTKSLNRALAMARGEFLARMDADDIAHPSRLEEQIAFLRAHREIVCCGTEAMYISESGYPLFVRRMPHSHEEIEICHLSGGGGFILHPTVMIRTNAFRDVGGYNEDYPFAQDYDLWFRLAKIGRLANMNCVLLDYRFTPSAITQARRREQAHCRMQIFARELHERGMKDVLPLPAQFAILPGDPWWVLVQGAKSGCGKSAIFAAGRSLRRDLVALSGILIHLALIFPLLAFAILKRTTCRR